MNKRTSQSQQQLGRLFSIAVVGGLLYHFVVSHFLLAVAHLIVSFEKMNVAEFEIDLELIKASIHQCLDKSFEVIDSNSEFAATSFGVSLDTRFGRFLIRLNDDDDVSYRCN